MEWKNLIALREKPSLFIRKFLGHAFFSSPHPLPFTFTPLSLGGSLPRHGCCAQEASASASTHQLLALLCGGGGGGGGFVEPGPGGLLDGCTHTHIVIPFHLPPLNETEIKDHFTNSSSPSSFPSSIFSSLLLFSLGSSFPS